MFACTLQKAITMQSFLRALEIQRWDDHRYYHHSRINQSLHLLSAISFLAAYVTIFTNPAASALIGWLVAMISRQVCPVFLEAKEDIKVGYNLRRKIVLRSRFGPYRRPCCGWTQRCSGSSGSTLAMLISFSIWGRSGWLLASVGCCFGRCSWFSSRPCRPGSSG